MLEQLLTRCRRAWSGPTCCSSSGHASGPTAPRRSRSTTRRSARRDGDDARCARILASRSLHQLVAVDVPQRAADARASLERADRTGDRTLIAAAIARLGHAEAYAVDITPGLLERGVEIEERRSLHLLYYESPRCFLARRLVASGEIDRAC